ncbi:MAG: Trigger factor [Patescibacteria group bacterium]|nr:Trigger factor [Patescibacteria group bacterium]
MKKNIKKLPNSIVEIEGELEAELFEKYFDPAFKKLGENFEMDGFRKGKVPENILVKNIPENKILEEMAGLALNEHYPNILIEEKIDAIGHPEITIKKLARNNPLEFKITTVVIPEVKLPDFKKIAEKINKEEKNKEEIAVTDEEVENTILDIRKSRSPKQHMGEPHKHKEGEEHEHAEPKEEELVTLDDEFVKALGPFENVEDFKVKLKENIKLEKENLAREKNRLKIIEEIIEGSTIDVPELLVDAELGKILYRMESDISQMGLKFEDYLKHIKKSVDDLKKDFRPDAVKRSKLSLVLNEIAKIEKLEPSKEDVEREVAHLIEHYKDADPERARMHAENVLTNERVFQFLESQK